MPIGIFISLFIFIISLITLIASVSFLIHPLDSRFAAVKALTRATIYATVLGFFSGMVFPFKNAIINTGNEEVVKVTGHFLGGVIESFVPVIIGFSILSLSWVVVALGNNRKGNASK